MASNYKFMKSGFNMIEQEPLSEEMIENLYALVYAFMEKAIISAEKYVSHSGIKWMRRSYKATMRPSPMRASRSAPSRSSSSQTSWWPLAAA